MSPEFSFRIRHVFAKITSLFDIVVITHYYHQQQPEVQGTQITLILVFSEPSFERVPEGENLRLALEVKTAT